MAAAATAAAATPAVAKVGFYSAENTQRTRNAVATAGVVLTTLLAAGLFGAKQAGYLPEGFGVKQIAYAAGGTAAVGTVATLAAHFMGGEKSAEGAEGAEGTSESSEEAAAPEAAADAGASSSSSSSSSAAAVAADDASATSGSDGGSDGGDSDGDAAS